MFVASNSTVQGVLLSGRNPSLSLRTAGGLSGGEAISDCRNLPLRANHEIAASNYAAPALFLLEGTRRCHCEPPVVFPAVKQSLIAAIP
jgi:hypothetical protein